MGKFLAKRFTYHDYDEWCRLIECGRVTLNGENYPPGSILSGGDILAYDVSDIEEPPVDFKLDIVADDEDLLIINKSGNLPCHPAGRYFSHTVWYWLRKEYGLPHPELVNRIDRETSGLVVIAKNREAAVKCRRQFELRRVDRRYLAIVEGRSFPQKIECNGWLVQDHESEVWKKRRLQPSSRKIKVDEDRAEWSETIFNRIEEAGALTLVEAMLQTGRQHQVRASLLSLGYPLVGDKIYGVDDTLFLRFREDKLSDSDWERLRMKRQALHAAELTLLHPRHQEPVTYNAPLPDDMNGLLKGSASYNTGLASSSSC